MTSAITNIKFINADFSFDLPELNFTADYFDADDNETLQLNISYRPTADNIDTYELAFNLDHRPESFDTDTINDPEFFDDDAIQFFVATAKSINLI